LKLYRITGPSLKSVPEMLDEFAEIDTRSEALPNRLHISNDVGLRRGSVAAKEGQRVGRS
jgi:hypothetical protein